MHRMSDMFWRVGQWLTDCTRLGSLADLIKINWFSSTNLLTVADEVVDDNSLLTKRNETSIKVWANCLLSENFIPNKNILASDVFFTNNKCGSCLFYPEWQASICQFRHMFFCVGGGQTLLCHPSYKIIAGVAVPTPMNDNTNIARQHTYI